jgi:hypothetical protein
MGLPIGSDRMPLIPGSAAALREASAFLGHIMRDIGDPPSMSIRDFIVAELRRGYRLSQDALVAAHDAIHQASLRWPISGPAAEQVAPIMRHPVLLQAFAQARAWLEVQAEQRAG